ncbi:hypothetical protein ACOMHN_020143 [Nucella lapillus]
MSLIMIYPPLLGVFGALDLHGLPSNVSWTRLSQPAAVGSNVLHVQNAVDWSVVDEVMLTPTDLNPWHTETFRITGLSEDKRQLTLNSSVQYYHQAHTQTLASGEKLEMRARVARLTRNIVVEGRSYDGLMAESYGARIVFGRANHEEKSYSERKQRGIAEASDCCISKDEEELSVCYTGNATKSEVNDGPGNVVFAHVFLNQSAKYDVKDDSDIRVLQWDNGVDSVSQGIKATPKLITVTQAGFYYVYSRVTLKENVTLTHQVISNRKGVLLSHTGKANVSSLQGMLELRAQDALSVNAPVNHLFTASFRATYFGAYLVRV